MKVKKIFTFMLALASMMCVSAAVACGEKTNESAGSNSNSSSIAHDSQPAIIEYAISDDGQYAVVEKGYGDGQFIIEDTFEGLPVQEISQGAFRDSGATSVKIPDTVTKIRFNAFMDCSALKSVNFPRDLTTLEQGAFAGCTALADIQYNATQCNDLERGDLPAMSGVGSRDFATLTVGANVKRIPNYLFESGKPVCDLILHFDAESVCEEIGEYAFEGVRIHKTTAPTTVVGEVPDPGYIVVINGGSEIRPYTFYLGRDIYSITIADTVTSIGEKAFEGCTALVDLQLPDTITSIGYYAFKDCIGLTNMVVPKAVTTIAYGAFEGCTGLNSVVMSEGVTAIYDDTFKGCTNLAELIVSENLLNADMDAFDGCEKLQFAKYGNCKYLSTANNPYHLLLAAEDTAGTSYQIHADAKAIADNAFARCRSLTSVVIPEGVRAIGEGAFSRCSALTSIEIPESAVSFGSNILENCNQLQEVRYTGSLASWCNISFESALPQTGVDLYIQNQLLVNLVIPETITVLNAYAFAHCTSLQTVEIGNQVTAVGKVAFSGCTNLTTVTIGDNVVSVGSGAFGNCSNLQFTEYENGKYLGNSGNPYLVLVDTTDNVTSFTIHGDTKIIAGGAFYKTRLTEITIPDNVKVIGEYAFYDCEKLKTVKIGDGVTKIEGMAFAECDYMKSLEFGAGLMFIGDGACSNCSELTSITFNGTTAQWDAVERNSSWRYNLPWWVKVLCSDGEGAL